MGNSVIALVAFGEAAKLWRIRKLDFMLWAVAFLGTLFLGVLLGISLAVALSLCIVIYESVRPQITILWRIPGTTIYRSVKQETKGSFVPNVFIARIGSSMYFANTSFIKDMLLTYIADLAEANRTEYVVLEMTPVVSIDTAAIHALQDIVHHFRSQGIEVAFAMVGNRVEKTMRRARLTDFVGEQWFFPTVNGAVHHCLQHQQVKRTRAAMTLQTNGDLGVSSSCDVHPGNEIGFSNNLHHECTAVFISRLPRAGQGCRFVSDVLSTFQRIDIIVMRTQVESSSDGVEKHFYLVRQAVSEGKLSDEVVEQLRQALAALLEESCNVAEAGQPPQMEVDIV